MLSDILTGLKVLFPVQAWSGRDFLNFVGGWEWGYIFFPYGRAPISYEFLFCQALFLLVSGEGDGEGWGEGKGGFPLCFVSLLVLPRVCLHHQLLKEEANRKLEELDVTLFFRPLSLCWAPFFCHHSESSHTCFMNNDQQLSR